MPASGLVIRRDAASRAPDAGSSLPATECPATHRMKGEEEFLRTSQRRVLDACVIVTGRRIGHSLPRVKSVFLQFVFRPAT